MSIALVAGGGILPVEIARKLAALQKPGLILSLGADVKTLRPYAGKIVKMKTPNLGRAINEIKSYGAEKLIMAGFIPKKLIYCLPLFFDSLSRSVLRNALHDDHSLLGSIVSALEGEGISVIPYWQILPEFIAKAGQLSSRSPTEKELSDINYGREILRVILPCSFGQGLCVADGSVVAVEAMEGTDNMITRAGGISGHGVVVKMMKAGQDMRYDLPTVGTRTLETMHKAGMTCLAVEAGKTLILEPEKFFELSEKYKIAIWGIKDDTEISS
ncbi:MAG: UDP-2,3-diacylglucosamine diphosphatase LpxI [Synergistaceae bacterium]|nr:UDP-2,3-diacylglucosamine diphosphatase LpxI [Synergistaceae bacterium]